MKKITVNLLENIEDVIKWFEENYNNKCDEFLFRADGNFSIIALDSIYNMMECSYSLTVYIERCEISVTGNSLQELLYSLRVKLQYTFLVESEANFEWWEEDEDGNRYPIFTGDFQI